MRPSMPAIDDEDDLARRLGDLARPARLAVGLDLLVGEPLDARAGFLLANVDGATSFADLLDLGGMPRADAARILCDLVMRGVLV